MTLLQLEHVGRTFRMDGIAVHALRDVTVSIAAGEMVAIVGPSGSGKSTLMNILGCLDRPTDGRYAIAGREVGTLTDDQLAALRSRTIGFVFQGYNLLPGTTALENVATPLLYQGVGRGERQRRAEAALERLGLSDRLGHEPTQLSGGEQQRVAIARALITDPEVILADEPTGNLPVHQGEEVMAILQQLNAGGRTIVLITHNPDVARVAGRRIHLRDGEVVAGEEMAA
jgi:putative ABC transport system ATP-binding protein